MASLVQILRRQFDPTFEMLAELVDTCPERVWASEKDLNPFWQQIMHVLNGIHFWFRQGEDIFVLPDMANDPFLDLGGRPANPLQKDKVRDYQSLVSRQVESFFAKLDDSRLTERSTTYPEFTFADLVLMQIRHIQHHVGTCNAILRTKGAATVRWLGFGE